MQDFDVQETEHALRRAEQGSGNGDRNLEVLSIIRTVLDQLLLLQDSSYLIEAASILANASRDESWRLPFRQSGLLELFLRLQASTAVEEDVLIPSLKFIGNTCADTGLYNRVEFIARIF